MRGDEGPDPVLEKPVGLTWDDLASRARREAGTTDHAGTPHMIQRYLVCLLAFGTLASCGDPSRTPASPSAHPGSESRPRAAELSESERSLASKIEGVAGRGTRPIRIVCDLVNLDYIQRSSLTLRRGELAAFGHIAPLSADVISLLASLGGSISDDSEEPTIRFAPESRIEDVALLVVLVVRSWIGSDYRSSVSAE